MTLNPSIGFDGYARNNAIDVADATWLNSMLVMASIADTGLYQLALNTTRVQALTNARTGALGILTLANSADLTVGFSTGMTRSSVAPSVEINYTAAVA